MAVKDAEEDGSVAEAVPETVPLGGLAVSLVECEPDSVGEELAPTSVLVE